MKKLLAVLAAAGVFAGCATDPYADRGGTGAGASEIQRGPAEFDTWGAPDTTPGIHVGDARSGTAIDDYPPATALGTGPQ